MPLIPYLALYAAHECEAVRRGIVDLHEFGSLRAVVGHGDRVLDRVAYFRLSRSGFRDAEIGDGLLALYVGRSGLIERGVVIRIRIRGCIGRNQGIVLCVTVAEAACWNAERDRDRARLTRNKIEFSALDVGVGDRISPEHVR